MAVQIRRLRPFLPPTAILLLIASLKIAAYLHLIPSTADLFGTATRYLRSASPIAIAVVSLLENIAGFTIYFPGSVVILVAMASTRGDIHRAVIVFGAIVLGAAVAQYADFLFGRWMRGRHEAMKRMRVRDFAAAALAYWHPQLGSVYSIQRGAAGWTYGAFTTILLSTWLPWNVFWGVLMYSVGTLPVSDEQWDSLFMAYVVIWLAWEVVKYVRSGRQQDDADHTEHPK